MVKPIQRSRQIHGSALLIILAFVTLLTVLVMSLLLTTRFERTASSLALSRAQADVLADYAADVAVERLREAIDDGRQFNSARYTVWASEPGRIHIFTIDQSSGSITRSARDMFSAPPGPDAESANVDLNKTGLSGLHPLTGSAPGVMKVGWIPIMPDSGTPPSKQNSAIGRIAYWVDDDSCKVNLNTADGSNKVLYNPNGSVRAGDITKSFGFGTPSEISLLAFGLSGTAAGEIASYAAVNGFNSVSEVLLLPAVPRALYSDHKFELAHTSRSPEINMFGEPKMYLFPVLKFTGATIPRNMAAGGYGDYNDWVNQLSAPANVPVATDTNPAAIYENISAPINFIYPCSALAPILLNSLPASQLPAEPAALSGTVQLPLPQCLAQWGGLAVSPQGTAFNSALNNYPLGMRIAQYLKGKNSQNSAITWPRFAGSTVAGFAGKYSNRQIDSIALQILDLAAGKNVLPDQARLYSQPAYSVKGFLNAGATEPKLVYGLGRSPKANEIQIVAEATPSSDAPILKMEMMLECFVPAGYVGPALRSISDFQFDADGSVHIPHSFNQQDRPYFQNGAPVENTVVSSTGGWWMKEMLQILDQTGTGFSGIDLFGWPSGGTTPMLDKAQTLAENYHPFVANSGSGTYVGENDPPDNRNKTIVPILGMTGPSGGNIWAAGVYHASPNTFGQYTRRGAPSVSTFKVRGGLALWTRTGSGAGNFWEVAPLDSMRGHYTGEGVDRTSTEGGTAWPDMLPGTLKAAAQAAVIPVNFDLPVGSRKTYTLQVSDPLVNKFPADWKSMPAADATIPARTASYTVPVYTSSAPNPDFPYPSGYVPTNTNGNNAGYNASGGGDPSSIWLPPQDIRMPKQARFPSVGVLNFVRTGMIPDDETLPLPQQAGIPWRSISFDSTSAAGQATASGIYPDWAMLDLFTVPFLPQRPYLVNNVTGAGPATPLRILTSGGSTEGRLNINNPKSPYPFSSEGNYAGVARTPYPERTTPLQALFYGIQPSNSYTSGGDPVFSGIDAVALAEQVQQYLASNGPFMLPGQLAEVPAISNFTYRGVAAGAQTRNDLLKNVLGATTTQSNTFSIWVVAQTFKKSGKNTDFSKFEPGDTVTGEVRKHFIVERLIETGKDGIPGNAVALTPKNTNLTNDGIPATPDDPIDPSYHPAMNYPLPYRYKILTSEEIAL